MKHVNQKTQAVFSPDRVDKLMTKINNSTAISVIGIPGVGISLFLKHLAAQNPEQSYYIDVFGLPQANPTEFFKAILSKLGGTTASFEISEIIAACKLRLEQILKTNEKIVIYFGGLDQLKKYFRQEFFHQLRSLQSGNQEKIVFVFGICRRIESLIPEDLMDTDLQMFSSVYYLKPYSPEDLTYLLSIYGPYTSEADMTKAITLSGGHFQFLQLLLRSERLHDPLNDPFIKLAMKNIYQHLTYQQKTVLKKVATQTVSETEDTFLINIGLVKIVDNSYQLFSPLFEDFVKSQNTHKLPVKEDRLLKLLKKNLGVVVSKDEIFNFVWQNDSDNASDWALDALIYRLRRHPVFLSKGFVIENHKKNGYALLKN